MASATRDHFSSRLGVLAATLGSAVGLGNIWKFPSLVGQNGGASFLVVYLLASLCIGLPLMISDLSLGRAGRSNVISIFQKLAPRTGWWLIGLSAIISCLLILGFYSDVAGWVFAYIFKSATGAVSSTDPAVAQASFSSLLNDGPVSLFWQWLVLLLTGGIIMRGASAGIEKVTRILMPVLFLLLVGVCIRSLTLRQFTQQDVLLTCGGLTFDTRSRTATVNGQTLTLTRKETGILEYLMVHQGRPVSQEELMDHVWDNSVDSFSNSIRVHISALRKKLRAVLGYDPIRNRIGEGYLMGGEEE
mgnify:FL=1